MAPVVENLPDYTGDVRDSGSTPGSGRSPGGGHGSPPQDSCLDSPMGRGVSRVMVHSVTESDMTEAAQHAEHTLLESTKL